MTEIKMNETIKFFVNGLEDSIEPAQVQCHVRNNSHVTPVIALREKHLLDIDQKGRSHMFEAGPSLFK